MARTGPGKKKKNQYLRLLYIRNGISIVKAAGLELWTVRVLKNGGWWVMRLPPRPGRDRRLTGGVKAVRVVRSGLLYALDARRLRLLDGGALHSSQTCRLICSGWRLVTAAAWRVPTCRASQRPACSPCPRRARPLVRRRELAQVQCSRSTDGEDVTCVDSMALAASRPGGSNCALCSIIKTPVNGAWNDSV